MNVDLSAEYHAELHATVIRADGTVEELGCIASTDDGSVVLVPDANETEE